MIACYVMISVYSLLVATLVVDMILTIKESVKCSKGEAERYEREKERLN